ncbi:formyltransferase family protein [Leptospira vanthielii]|uniref:Methionyl-tRNA formyltransferase n=1 Tax=Leptospira vanthielii TaxID=293085 RepID=A0ABY2NST8_9LEPT|nr:formyltransferase family protein [Leptospira vanthielii]TGM60691.1 methionyl-tRNA formyltransferase [Leptospira vanthielii]
MKILCVGYREWALEIYDELAKKSDNVFLILRSKSQFSEGILNDFKPDLVLFYGWSWIIPAQILENYKCLMLHPSPLPKYRGGSPIQNQIIAGEKKSMVSIFVMTNELDAGDILVQKEISFEGKLSDIFRSIVETGISSTLEILENDIRAIKQDDSQATYCKRRKPEDSEITIDEIKSASAEYLYNKIRMLADPYPNAYIRTADGKKLFLKESEISED